MISFHSAQGGRLQKEISEHCFDWALFQLWKMQECGFLFTEKVFKPIKLNVIIKAVVELSFF